MNPLAGKTARIIEGDKTGIVGMVVDGYAAPDIPRANGLDRGLAYVLVLQVTSHAGNYPSDYIGRFCVVRATSVRIEEDSKIPPSPRVSLGPDAILHNLKAVGIHLCSVREGTWRGGMAAPEMEYWPEADDLAKLARAMGNPPAPRPTFNHTRGDGEFNPCPECLRLMTREQLIALVDDMRQELE